MHQTRLTAAPQAFEYLQLPFAVVSATVGRLELQARGFVLSRTWTTSTERAIAFSGCLEERAAPAQPGRARHSVSGCRGGCSARGGPVGGPSRRAACTGGEAGVRRSRGAGQAAPRLRRRRRAAAGLAGGAAGGVAAAGAGRRAPSLPGGLRTSSLAFTRSLCSVRRVVAGASPRAGRHRSRRAGPAPAAPGGAHHRVGQPRLRCPPPPLQRQLATPAPRHCRPRTSWWSWWA